jgi:hypothetical protein
MWFFPRAAQTVNVHIIIFNAFARDTKKILLKTGQKVFNENSWVLITRTAGSIASVGDAGRVERVGPELFFFYVPDILSCTIDTLSV